jgi:hypothetical protein
MTTVHRLSLLLVFAAAAWVGGCGRDVTPPTAGSLPTIPLPELEPTDDRQLDAVVAAPSAISAQSVDEPVAASDPPPAAEASPPQASPTTVNPTQTQTSAAEDPVPRATVVERKSSATARARGEINFDDLKFELAKDAPFESELLTEEIRQLVGTKVKLRGYILPSTLFSETNISQFVLVRDNQECCFGPGAALFDCVMVQMVGGETTDFVTRPVTVEGTFVIDTESYRYPPGYSPVGGATHMAVFRIEGESVQ